MSAKRRVHCHCAICHDVLLARTSELTAERDSLREVVEKLHPRVFRLIEKGREFLVVGIHEPYYRQVYDLIRSREQDTKTWTEGDEECYARAVIKWHDMKIAREAALAAKEKPE